MPGVKDRVAVVTGGANGLGREIALLLAREGARVALGDIDGAELERTAAAITKAGGTAVTLAGDLTEESGAARLIEVAAERLGGLDILINNVGGSRNRKVWEMPVEDWDFVLRLNLRPTFLCTRAAVPHMMRRRYGRIVCMSSGAREGTPWTAYYQGGAAYSAAKAGIHGFVRDTALELAEHGINVNAVAPGPIDTERAGPNLKRLNDTVDYSPNRMTPLIPALTSSRSSPTGSSHASARTTNRLGQPIEVAHAVLFLASEEASYITGHTLAVAGGR